MSRRIRFIVKSADLQDINSEKETINPEGNGKTVAFRKKKTGNEGENREKRDRDSRQSNKSSKKNDPKQSRKGKPQRNKEPEERDRSSSNRAEVRIHSRVSSRRDRGLSQKNGGNIESIQPVRGNIVILPVGYQIVIIEPATAYEVGGNNDWTGKPSTPEGLLRRVGWVLGDESIRIITRFAFNLLWVLASLLLVLLLAKNN